MNTFEKDHLYVAPTYTRFPVEIVGGHGEILIGSDGKEYIDLGSGIACNTFGTADEQWISAVTSQLNTIQHTSNLYYTKPCANLAELLCKKTGMKKVFFGNSGAEANECAIKAARKYAAAKKGKDYYTIVTLVNSFHGRTITTLSATGQDVFHKDFCPLTPGFVYANANDCESLRNAVLENKCAAIMMEMIQGEGGVNPLSKDFVNTAVELANEYDLLIITDEVQTGNGRTGELYAYMNYGITPDIVTTAKGLGGGLPLGATILGEKVQDIFTSGDHGSTFGGNPVCCAGAVNILSRIDTELLNGVKERSKYIIEELSGATGVISITGMGLMLGIETERPAGDVIKDAMEMGVLPLKAKSKVRLLPPLNISMDNLKKAIAILKAAIAGNTNI